MQLEETKPRWREVGKAVKASASRSSGVVVVTASRADLMSNKHISHWIGIFIGQGLGFCYMTAFSLLLLAARGNEVTICLYHNFNSHQGHNA